jgi:hypothetical protein
MQTVHRLPAVVVTLLAVLAALASTMPAALVA